MYDDKDEKKSKKLKKNSSQNFDIRSSYVNMTEKETKWSDRDEKFTD